MSAGNACVSFSGDEDVTSEVEWYVEDETGT